MMMDTGHHVTAKPARPEKRGHKLMSPRTCDSRAERKQQYVRMKHMHDSARLQQCGEGVAGAASAHR